MKKLTNSFLLLLTALIWGIAFLAQSVGMDYVGAFTFNGVRSFIGGIVLIPCIFVINKIKAKSGDKQNRDKKTVIIGGVICGTLLFVASSLQQIGLMYTSPGKAGFITALYIILVPVAGIFLGRRPGIKLAFAAVGALIGLYFLCFTGDSFTLELGDLLIFICAIVFTAHILVIDRFSPKVDGVLMSCIQFFVCAALSFVPMMIFEEPTMSAIFAAKIPILYAGVMSCGVAYTLQIVGQKGVNPTLASLILSLESCFALLGEFVYLKLTGAESFMSAREISGCVIVFAAIILAQLPDLKKNKKESAH